MGAAEIAGLMVSKSEIQSYTVSEDVSAFPKSIDDHPLTVSF